MTIVVEEATIKPGDDSDTLDSETRNEVFFEMLGLPDSGLGDASFGADDYCVDLKTSEAPMPCVEFLSVPQRCSRHNHDPTDVASFVINDFLDARECQSIISLANDLSPSGFHYVTEAVHTDIEGRTYVVSLQEPNKHKLSVFEHKPTLDTLWTKLEPVLLPHLHNFTTHSKSGAPLGLNPRLRVLRYDTSDCDVFDPHFDATTHVSVHKDSSDLISLLTVLVYLNDGGGLDFDGGETCFLDSTNTKATSTIVVPSAGKVVVFEHDLYHSSAPLYRGTKYVLRTDILFECNIPDGGVEKPRGCKNDEFQDKQYVSTLFELCEKISLSEYVKSCLVEAGLNDMTLDSLFAPGTTAVRHILVDVLEDDTAELIIRAALNHRHDM